MDSVRNQLKTFLAIVVGLCGVLLIAKVGIFGPFWFHWVEYSNGPQRVIDWDNVFQAVLGVILLAAGIIHFWTRSRFNGP